MIMVQRFTDIDVDVKNRDDILKTIPHTRGIERYINGEYILHKSGVYFDDIPKDPVKGCASIPYKEAEQLGYQKVDFLNVHVYDSIKSRDDLKKLVLQEPIWELFTIPEFISELFQLGNQISIVVNWPPKSVMQLAMLLAMIRPAKFHLVGASSWEAVEKEIWDYSTTNGRAYLKKAHAVAYALAIVAQLNQLVLDLGA